MKSVKEIGVFLNKEIWQINLKGVSGGRKYLIKLIRTFIIAWRDFKKDNCQLKASALTFYTLLSIVPIIAMFFGIAKGFGLQNRLEKQFKSDLSYNQEIIGYVFDFANSMLAHTKGGLIAGLGVALLFWSVMKVLGNIEASFNDIWEIKNSRSWVRKFTDYLAVMLVAPILTILSGSITVFVQTQLNSATSSIEMLSHIGPVFEFFITILPFILTVALFTLIYIVMPNTKVNLSAAAFGAFLASIIFIAAEDVYIIFQVGVSRYNAIYGGFAALPLFLAWVQTSWLIILLGAEISFAFQNQSEFEFEVESVEISQSYRFVLSVAVTHSLVKRFKVGEEPLTANEISEGLQLPAKLVRRILNDLVQCQVLAETSSGSKSVSRFLPAVDIDLIDILFIQRRLNQYGINELPIEKNEGTLLIESKIAGLISEIEKSKSNVLIKDL